MVDEKTAQIFDKIFKRMMHLSKGTVIDFINAMFLKNYNRDVSLEYIGTEYVSSSYQKRISDIIIKIDNRDKYHIECQSSEDSRLIIRMFEYGYDEALASRIKESDRIVLEFAEPKIIYLNYDGNIHDEMVIVFKFQGQGETKYRVPVLKLLDKSVEEILRERLIVLLPFYLLKMRNLSEMAIEDQLKYIPAFKHMLNDEVLSAIDYALEVKLIDEGDYGELLVMLNDLYSYLYGDMSVFSEEGVDDKLTEKNLLWSEQLIEKGVIKGIIAMGLKFKMTEDDLWNEVIGRYPTVTRENFNEIYDEVIEEINVAS